MIPHYSSLFLVLLDTPDFTTATNWAKDITTLIEDFGFALSGGAFAMAFILLMFSRGNERSEATAKAAIWCAALGLFGLLAIGGLELVISHIVGVDLPK